MNHLEIVTPAGRWRTDTAAAVDISIPLDFDGPQPVHFHAEPAAAEPMVAGGFTGDTRQGGSCNADIVSLNPHCNGTHTECVGHLTDDPLAPRDILGSLYFALLVSIKPERAGEARDSSDPQPRDNDLLITRAALARAMSRIPDGLVEALVVRTRPNRSSKQSRVYVDSGKVPYFSREAMRFLVGRGIHHLLTDTPSVDRMDDDGKLTAHRLFWGLPRGSRKLSDAVRPRSTITEMIFVPNDVPDGRYLLDLQIAPFLGDATPSRPMLYPLEPA